MARSLLHQYWDLPEGTECHRKAYASTSVGGAAGECPRSRRAQEVTGSLQAVRGRPGGLGMSQGGLGLSSGCLGRLWGTPV